MRHADAYIREFNVAHPDTPITIQHMLMWSIAQILEQFPTMNRFVVGGRLYQRKDIWFTYSAKQSLKGKSPLIVIKRRFDPAEPFVDMVRDMQEQLHDDRYSGRMGPSDQEAALILKFPGVVRRDHPRRRAVGRRVRSAPRVDDRARPALRQRVLRQPGVDRHGRLLPPPLRVRQHRHLRRDRAAGPRSGLPHQRSRPAPHHDPPVDLRRALRGRPGRRLRPEAVQADPRRPPRRWAFPTPPLP